MSISNHDLAVRIYEALNKKGAGLGNMSIPIIERAIDTKNDPPLCVNCKKSIKHHPGTGKFCIGLPSRFQSE